MKYEFLKVFYKLLQLELVTKNYSEDLCFFFILSVELLCLVKYKLK